MIKAIFFDLDGVLVDACDWHFQAFAKAWKEYSGQEISADFHQQKLNGLPTRMKLKHLGCPDKDIDQINQLKQKYTIETIKTTAKIDTIKQSMYTYMWKQNIRAYCVTNSIRKTAELMLNLTGQSFFIDRLITNEDCDPKPSPDGYNLALKKSGLKPEEVAIVEDSPVGFEAAILSKIPNIFLVEGTHQVNKDLIDRILQKVKT